jgi:hypothetical protein
MSSTTSEAGLALSTSFADAMKDSVGRKEFYTVENVMITPEDARDILAFRRLPRERFLTERTVEKYKRDMETGVFYGPLHTIKFGLNDKSLPEDQFIPDLPEGEPIEYDGQHRLRAIVLTGMPQTLTVMFNVPPEAHGNIDDNRVRRMSDQLRFKGEDLAPQLERLINRAHAWNSGKRTYSGHVQPTVQEAERFVADDPSLRDAVTIASTFKADKLATPTALAFLYWVIRHESKQSHLPNRMLEFFTDLHTGANMDEGDPVLVLRDRLREEFHSKEPQLRRTHNQIHMGIASWNHRAKGTKVSFFRVPKVKADLPMPL